MNDGRLRDMGGLFLGALVVRVTALATVHAMGRFPELWEHDTIARNLLEGRGFVYPFRGIQHWAYSEPLYPLLAALVYLIAGVHPLVLAGVQCVIASALALVVYVFARRTFGRPSAIAAGALVALDPALAGYATKLHPLTLDTLAIILVALTLLRLLERPDPRRAVVFGLATGVCLLTRPTVALFVAAALVWTALRREWRPVFTKLILAAVIAAAVVTPWIVRNYLRVGAFVPTRSHVGFNFWLGNHPGATGTEGDPADPTGTRSLFDLAAPEFRERVLSERDEIGQDRVFWSEALAYTAREPLAFVERTVRKLGYFWWFPPSAGRLYGRLELVVYRAFYVAMLALAILGLARARRRAEPGQGDGLRVTLLALGTIAVAQSLFYVQGRHRLGVEALLLVLSGHGLAWAQSRKPRDEAGARITTRFD